MATTVSAGNKDFARELGADVVIDYRTEDFVEILHDYDLVLDSLGGENLERSLKVLKKGGKAIGIAGPPDAGFARQLGGNPVLLGAMTLLSSGIRRKARRLGVTYEFLFMRADGGQLREIAALIDAGEIKPVLGRVVPFDQTADVLAALEKGGVRGKTVVSHL